MQHVTLQFTVDHQMKHLLNQMAQRRGLRPTAYNRGLMAARATIIYLYLTWRALKGDTILIHDRKTGESQQLLMDSSPNLA